MTDDLSSLSGLPADPCGPVFAAPWEAQAFAMVVHLHDQGAFTWEQWAAHLAEEIRSGPPASYYEHWLAALETIVAARDLAPADALAARKRAWIAAAEATPHGTPISL